MNLPKLKLHNDSFQEGEMLSSIGDEVLGTNSKVFDNEAIIRQIIQKQPEKGFEMVFKRYYNQLCSHSLRYVYSTEVAEDIVSDVFMGFWRNELYASVKTTFRAYLYTAVRNRSLDYLKIEFRKRKAKEEGETVIENQSDMNDPQSILLMNELMNKITNSINNFPPQCQRVFMLSRIEGKKNREIADILDINIKTVEDHMMKALASLRKVLLNYI